jgi:hypothetical protein
LLYYLPHGGGCLLPGIASQQEGYSPPLLIYTPIDGTSILRVSPQESVGIANRMAASLIGPGFTITPRTEKDQPVSESKETTWVWYVIPKETGSQPLHLELSAVIYVADQPTPLTLRIGDGEYYQILEVDTPWVKRVSSFIANNWQWLWATILVPAAVFLSRRVRNLFSKLVLKRP